MQAGESPDIRAHWAIRYFRSGWAFLVPYTVAYFTYAALKWPVNPGGAGEGVVKGMSESVGGSSSLLPAPCSLLHLYWALHAAHVLLGAFALRTWWRGAKSRGQGAGGSAGSPPASRLPSPASRALSRALPWIGLALLFWIPGVYLEFPADPWQHYARTNEWLWHDLVGQHSYWNKASYFLAYSVVGHAGLPLAKLRCFDIYYTACCLLLCWQYFRLARSVGLGERAALLFVALNALTFGNNLFGFYRYYGMSSTLFAQLGAVALTRIVLEAMRGSQEPGDRTPEDLTPAAGIFHSFLSRLPSPVSRLLPHAFSAIGALIVTAGNHIQGALIAGAGIAAVACWRLVAWRRSMLGWLVLTAVLASVATVLWWPRHPLIDASYRPGGWLTAWYAFNLGTGSPAFERAWVILGAAGALNLLAGLWLLRRNHVVGWLTLTPVLMLCLPCFTLPFANVLAASPEVEGGYIIAFHRLLLGIPASLALVVALSARSQRAGQDAAQYPGEAVLPWIGRPVIAQAAIVVSVAALVLVPAGRPAFNRLFSTLAIPAGDLSLRHTTEAVDALVRVRPDPQLGRKFVTAYSPGYSAKAYGLADLILATKWNIRAQPTTAIWLHNYLRYIGRTPSDWIFLPPESQELVSPGSTIAHLSGHWVPYHVATEHVGFPELTATALEKGGVWRTYGGFRFIEHRSNNGPPVRPTQ